MATRAQAAKDKLTASLDENMKAVQHMLANCSDVVYRPVKVDPETRGVLIYLSNMVDLEAIRTHILGRLQDFAADAGAKASISEHVSEPGMSALEQISSAVQSVVNAEAVLLVDGLEYGYRFNVSSGTRRSVQEPASETVVRGPREGFTEEIGVNLSLIRNKLRTDKLKTVNYVIGRETKTKVILAYLDHIANKDTIEEIKRRLDSIDIDAVLETGYIEELIEDDPTSPFPLFQYSERPDTVTAQLLEGDTG